jgi:putative thiamine transport system permease protein
VDTPLRRLSLHERQLMNAVKGLKLGAAGPMSVMGLIGLSAALPLGWTLLAAAWQVADASAWRALWADPQAGAGWRLSLGTGLAAAALSWLSLAALLSHGFVRQLLGQWLRVLPALLATPHAAMAVGLVAWLAPSGWLLRLVSPGLTGFESPPPWVTTQDPWGLGLILTLWLKETPFLLWVAATQLQRDDLRRQWQAEFALAQTLGRTPTQAFTQVVWPQLAPRLRWPLLAVLAYGLTVVDVALIIGPATPPTLGVLAWQWLLDADLATNAQGAAAAAVLTLSVAVCAALLWSPAVFGALCTRAAGAWVRTVRRRGDAAPNRQAGAGADAGLAQAPSRCAAGASSPLLWLAGYGAVWWALGVGSVSGVWPFPAVWPSLLTLSAWAQVADSHSTWLTTLGLAMGASSAALLWCLAWLEWAPPRWQTWLEPWLYLPLVVPAVMWVVGLYELSLSLGLEGHTAGVLLAHTLMVLPYVLLALVPAYRSVDPRQAQLAASLGHGRWPYLLRVKWPLLQRALASAWAVGFAVSVAQYLPTLYVGAGRWSTVTTEAVTLASGAQRSLSSAYAVLQMGLPLAAFALAAWLGRPRRFEKAT